MALAIPCTLGCTGALAAIGCRPTDHEHTLWTRLLQRHVAEGRVDYATLDRDDRGELTTYLTGLSDTCAEDYRAWSREQRIAFWLNAYNAFTVELILRNQPVDSIRRIGWLPGAAFREEFIPMPELRGGEISLNDIEHDVLRREFREPRIHFALVCASRSCPPLRSEAYRARDLDRQLDDQARVFLGDATKNRFDAKESRLYLSAIFDWFDEDFVAAAGSLPAFVARYRGDVQAALSGRAGSSPAITVEFLDYDWSLNDRRRPATSGAPVTAPAPTATTSGATR